MKYEAYYNGEKVTMEWVAKNYGEEYAKELKKEIKSSKPYSTIYSEDRMLEIETW